MNTKEIKKGDDVLLEQCWEDEAGQYHDEWVEVSRILPDGRLKFHYPKGIIPEYRRWRLQSYLNQQEWYAKDVSDIES